VAPSSSKLADLASSPRESGSHRHYLRHRDLNWGGLRILSACFERRPLFSGLVCQRAWLCIERYSPRMAPSYFLSGRAAVCVRLTNFLPLGSSSFMQAPPPMLALLFTAGNPLLYFLGGLHLCTFRARTISPDLHEIDFADHYDLQDTFRGTPETWAKVSRLWRKIGTEAPSLLLSEYFMSRLRLLTCGSA